MKTENIILEIILIQKIGTKGENNKVADITVRTINNLPSKSSWGAIYFTEKDIDRELVDRIEREVNYRDNWLDHNCRNVYPLVVNKVHHFGGNLAWSSPIYNNTS